MLRDQDLGRFAQPTKLTLDAFFDRWLKEVAEPKLRERTLNDYCYLLDRYLRPALGGQSLGEITPLVIQSQYGILREQKGLGIPSLRKLHVVFSSSLDEAVRWGLLTHNPAASVKVSRGRLGLREDKIRMLNPDQARVFLGAAKNDRWGIVFSLALATGLRPSEYLALLWKDIDFAGARLVVQRSLFRPKKGGWRFETPKTRGSYRTVTLPSSLLDELREHRAQQWALEQDQADLVFRSLGGQPLHANNLLKRHLRPILKSGGLDTRLNLYSLRHSHATLLLLAGVNPKVVAERLGHGSVQLTLDIYSHVIPSLQKEVATQIDGLLFGTEKADAA